MLLDDRYAPITDAIGFLETDLARVIAAETQWRSRIGGYEARTIEGKLPFIVEALLPLTGPLVRHVWVQTIGGWTAYFDNSVNGSDPFPPVSYLATQIGCRGVRIDCSKHTSRRGASALFELYGPERTDWLNVVRAVAAVEEDKGSWTWDATGEVQPFEDTKHYQKRRVRDRLTAEILDSYCRSLGVHPYDDTFYADSAFLVTNQNIQGSLRTETLLEARTWHGLA